MLGIGSKDIKQKSEVRGQRSEDQSSVVRNGFTLVEVMATITVLSLSIVLIYQSFFTSLDSLNYCAAYLNAGMWADETIWQAQDKLKQFGPSAPIQTAGSFMTGNRSFDWDLSYGLVDAESNLYEIDLVISQEKDVRKIGFSRTAYVAYEEK